MKKIILSTVVAMVSVNASDIKHPHERIEEFKQISSETKTVAIEKSILDRIHLKGDLRLRYESIERDDTTNKYRNRYRLRLGSAIDFTDNLHFEAGMRSGYANPTSGNQTFSTSKPVSDYFLQSLRFNVLSLSYKLDDALVKIGRQPYMMYRPIKSQLVWDNDVSMNGINYQYKDKTKMITLGINRPTLEEKSQAKNNVNLFVAQYMQRTHLDSTKLNLGAGLYYYDGLKGNTELFGSSKGNTVSGGKYTNDYHILQGFGELQFGDVMGKPLKVALSVAYNFAATKNNFGYDVALQLGKAKHVGDWQVKYSYTDIQEDAVFGAYCDSDNFGGGTAAKGHAIRTKYKMDKKLYLAGSFFFNTYYESKSKISGTTPKYERVQLDCIVKF